MHTKDIFEILNSRFENKGLTLFAQEAEGGDPFLLVPPEVLVEVGRFVKEDPRLDFKMLHSLSGVDFKDHLASVVHLYSLNHRHKLVLRTDCSRADARVPSLAEVWKAANWHEREAFDLLGIVYEGHPDLRRILLSEDWEGHPLRKDYQLPDDTLFPWEGDEEPVSEGAAPVSRPTAPGAEGGALERPDSSA